MCVCVFFVRECARAETLVRARARRSPPVGASITAEWLVAFAALVCGQARPKPRQRERERQKQQMTHARRRVGSVTALSVVTKSTARIRCPLVAAQARPAKRQRKANSEEGAPPDTSGWEAVAACGNCVANAICQEKMLEEQAEDSQLSTQQWSASCGIVFARFQR